MPYINSFGNVEREINERLDSDSKRKKQILQKRRASGMQVLLYDTKRKVQEMQLVWKMEAKEYRAPLGSTYVSGVFFSLCDSYETTIYIPTKDLETANQLLRDFAKLQYLDLTPYDVENLGIYTHYGKMPA